MATQDAPQEKRCTTCGQVKTLADFRVDSQKPDGLSYKCRSCFRSGWQNSPPGVRQKSADRSKSRKASNPGMVRTSNAQASSRWRKAHPDMALASVNRRRARLASAEHQPYSRSEILSRWNNTCAYCDAPAEHLDHVVPISKRGADAEHNLLPACATCNLSKGAKTLAQWAASFTNSTESK